MIIAAREIKKNTFQLAHEDRIWMGKNQNASPTRFVHGILRRRFDDAPRRFKDKEFLATAAREIAKSYSQAFKNNPIDQAAYEGLLDIDTSRIAELVKE